MPHICCSYVKYSIRLHAAFHSKSFWLCKPLFMSVYYGLDVAVIPIDNNSFAVLREYLLRDLQYHKIIRPRWRTDTSKQMINDNPPTIFMRHLTHTKR